MFESRSSVAVGGTADRQAPACLVIEFRHEPTDVGSSAMLLVVAAIAAHNANAACPADVDELRDDMAAATQAHGDWAWDDFDTAMGAVRADLGCLTEVLPSVDAKAAHLLFALAGASAHDEDQTIAAYRGLLTLEPQHEPDSSLAPTGSLQRRAWEEAKTSGAGPEDPLPEGIWFVDGKPGQKALPLQRAALVQLLEAGGLQSWYLCGGELPEGLRRVMKPSPVAPAEPAPVPVEPNLAELQAETAEVLERERHPSRTMFISGLALVAVGVAGLTVGETLDLQVGDGWKSLDADDVEKRYALGLACTIGGLTLGAAGGGLVLGAVFERKW